MDKWENHSPHIVFIDSDSWKAQTWRGNRERCQILYWRYFVFWGSSIDTMTMYVCIVVLCRAQWWLESISQNWFFWHWYTFYTTIYACNITYKIITLKDNAIDNVAVKHYKSIMGTVVHCKTKVRLRKLIAVTKYFFFMLHIHSYIDICPVWKTCGQKTKIF